MDIIAPADAENEHRVKWLIELLENKRAASVTEAYRIMDKENKDTLRRWMEEDEKRIRDDQAKAHRAKMEEEAERIRRAEEKRADEAERARKEIEDMLREEERRRRGW